MTTLCELLAELQTPPGQGQFFVLTALATLFVLAGVFTDESRGGGRGARVLGYLIVMAVPLFLVLPPLALALSAIAGVCLFAFLIHLSCETGLRFATALSSRNTIGILCGVASLGAAVGALLPSPYRLPLCYVCIVGLAADALSGPHVLAYDLLPEGNRTRPVFVIYCYVALLGLPTVFPRLQAIQSGLILIGVLTGIARARGVSGPTMAGGNAALIATVGSLLLVLSLLSLSHADACARLGLGDHTVVTTNRFGTSTERFSCSPSDLSGMLTRVVAMIGLAAVSVGVLADRRD